jgi:hypothetical protein
MSYTSGKRSPPPSRSEQEFARLTDEEREGMTRRWLLEKGFPPQEVKQLCQDEGKSSNARL